jgi:hypothetical protein
MFDESLDNFHAETAAEDFDDIPRDMAPADNQLRVSSLDAGDAGGQLAAHQVHPDRPDEATPEDNTAGDNGSAVAAEPATRKGSQEGQEVASDNDTVERPGKEIEAFPQLHANEFDLYLPSATQLRAAFTPQEGDNRRIPERMANAAAKPGVHDDKAERTSASGNGKAQAPVRAQAVTPSEDEEITSTQTLNIYTDTYQSIWSLRRIGGRAAVAALVLLVVGVSALALVNRLRTPEEASQTVQQAPQQSSAAAGKGTTISRAETQNDLSLSPRTTASAALPETMPAADKNDQTRSAPSDVELTAIEDRSAPAVVSKTPVVSRRPRGVRTAQLALTVTDGASALLADIYIDGQRYGGTGADGRILVQDLELRRPYLIKVQKNGFKMWAREFNFVVPGDERTNIILEESEARQEVDTVRAEATATPPAAQTVPEARLAPQQNRNAPLAEQLDAIVSVNLNNAEDIRDAYIYVNGVPWDGELLTAPADLRLPEGNYEIEVRKAGYNSAPLTYAINVSGGDRKSLSFILIPN